MARIPTRIYTVYREHLVYRELESGKKRVDMGVQQSCHFCVWSL